MKKKPLLLICFFLFFLFLLSLPSCNKSEKNRQIEEEKSDLQADKSYSSDQSQSLTQSEKTQNAKAAAIKSFVASLEKNVFISQLFLVNIEGSKSFANIERTGALEGKPEEGDPLLPGGCLLFSFNIADSAQAVSDFIKSIRDFYAKHNIVAPYIAIDQEGGDVNRLRDVTSRLPSQKLIADYYSLERAREIYSLQASQMKMLGFDVNLAPVVEAANEENSLFLGTRSFGSIEKTVDFSRAQIEAFAENGITSVLKHFPGNTDTDPHSGLPEIKVTRARLKAEYLNPFERLLPESKAVLVSHARVFVTDDEARSADSETPVCLSEFWVNEILRGKLGFDGLVFSDDIFMSALSDNGFPPQKAAVLAIQAGVDCIMLSEKRFASVAKFLLDYAKEDQEFATRLNEAVCRVIKFKIDAGVLSLIPVHQGENQEDAELEFAVVSSQAADANSLSADAASKEKTFDACEFEKLFSSGTEALSRFR